MAFKDSNGRITIDDIAAEKDIANVRAANEHLIIAEKLLSQMITISSGFSGNTGKSISEASALLQKQVRLMMEYSDNTVNSIHAVIRKYEEKDRQLKELINGSAMGREV